MSMLIVRSPQPLRLPEAAAAAGRPQVPPAMIALFRKWRRNKSLLRSSSGPCYPYPRSHSTVMVVPSGRPSAEEPPPKKVQQPRRRPPLNRAIPTIPESKSNESIMSHASRVSQVQEPTTSTDCVVIENRGAVQRLPPVTQTQAMRRSTHEKSSTPRSPLMTVAHTVRDKLSRLTKRKTTTQTTSSSGVKTSQSFSGFRAPPPPTPRVDENSNRVIKSSSMEVPLLDRPSTSKVVIPQCPEPLFVEEPSEAGELSSSTPAAPMSATSDPVVPSPPPLSSSPEVPMVCVSMKADVLVVTKVTEVSSPAVTNTEQHTTVIVAERPRELPISVVYAPEEPKKVDVKIEDKENDRPAFDVKELPPIAEVSSPKRKESVASQKFEAKVEKSKSPERFVMTVKTPEAQRKNRTFVVEERKTTEVVQTSVPLEEVIEKVEVAAVEAQPTEKKMEREDSKSPERFVMRVKSPEPQRHRVFTVQQKSVDEPENVIEVVPPPVVETRGRTEQRRAEEKKPKKKASSAERKEDTKSPERYIMTIKTPEPLRKHRVLTIAQCEAPPTTTTESRKMTRSRSEERPTLRIWTSLKKSLALRRTQTFSSTTIEQGPEARVQVEVQPVLEAERKEEKTDEVEDEKKERFVIVTKTPQFLRRHHTFMVGERPKSPDVPWIEDGLLTEPIATVGPEAKKREKRTRSEEPRKAQEEQPERFVMTARTPLTMRKYQTFVVENKKATPQIPTSMSADVAEVERRGDVLLKELDAIYPTSSRLDHRESLSDETVGRFSSKDMYVLTSTTPQLRRRDEVSSPKLFVLHKRAMERPIEDDRRLEAVRECSQSDRAELKSALSGELTSLEEDIPMDTAGEEPIRPVIAVLPLTSRPVAGSPKTTRKKKKATIAGRLANQSQTQRDHRLLRGLRNAGKIFSPSSFLKNKKPPTHTQTSIVHLTAEHPSRRAPLAELESSVVANSPMVESLPIETWNTPRPRGSPPRGYAALIREEIHDANGNPQPEESCPAPTSPQLLHRGLIDDEILDQPMLVGDSFSHSESSDRLSERAQLERSSVFNEQPRRSDVAPTASPPRQDFEFVDQSLAQVADIKSQLLDLQTLLNEHSAPTDQSAQDAATLARENDSLRRQLLERDQLIEQLRSQLAALRPVPVSL